MRLSKRLVKMNYSFCFHRCQSFLMSYMAAVETSVTLYQDAMPRASLYIYMFCQSCYIINHIISPSPSSLQPFPHTSPSLFIICDLFFFNCGYTPIFILNMYAPMHTHMYIYIYTLYTHTFLNIKTQPIHSLSFSCPLNLSQ